MSIIFYVECIVALISLYKAAWNLGTGKTIKGILFAVILFSMAVLMAPELNSTLAAMV